MSSIYTTSIFISGGVQHLVIIRFEYQYDVEILQLVPTVIKRSNSLNHTAFGTYIYISFETKHIKER